MNMKKIIIINNSNQLLLLTLQNMIFLFSFFKFLQLKIKCYNKQICSSNLSESFTLKYEIITELEIRATIIRNVLP